MSDHAQNAINDIKIKQLIGKYADKKIKPCIDCLFDYSLKELNSLLLDSYTSESIKAYHDLETHAYIVRWSEFSDYDKDMEQTDWKVLKDKEHLITWLKL